MVREEFIALRRETRAFLANIQLLPGFGARLAALDPPAAVVDWRWAGIKRVLTVPGETVEGLPPGILRWTEHGPKDEPPPDYDVLTSIDEYAVRVEQFARKLLINVSWGPRVVHEALRTGTAIELPHARPEPLIRIGAATLTELEVIVRLHRPRRELRGTRRTTWTGAVAAVQARLEGRPVSERNRQHASSARRYLEAAVNRELPNPGQTVDPVQPTDHPLWEAHVAQRIRARKAR
jgi:hypothetical protein